MANGSPLLASPPEVEPSAATGARRRRADGRPSRGAAFRRDRVALVATGYLVVVGLVALLASVLAPHDPTATDLYAINKPPGTAGHLFGTDDLGRDTLSRLLYGTRVSLVAGLISVAVAVAIALPLGLVAGYFGGRLDELLMRIVDVLMSIPPLILVFAIAGILGPSLQNAIIALAILFVPLFLRLTRSEARAARASQLVEAERSLGVPDRAILTRHLLPGISAPLVVQATLTIGTAILAEASLSFLGLGVKPPQASWGSMVSTGLQFLRLTAWPVVIPCIAIALTVLAFNLVGDGLNDALAEGERQP
jgi:ABC-type dipeptide/oligopeptide/nickel transport system permease subunit